MKRNLKKGKTVPAGKPLQEEMPIPQALELATKHHNTGNLATAEKIYRKVLTKKRDHPVALHLLGVIAHQTGKNDLAIDLIEKALNVQPNLAEAHNNLGLAQQTLFRFDDAIRSYRKAIEIKPNFVQAHSNLGVALQELGRVQEAESCYRRALILRPDYAEAQYNLGNALRDLGKAKDAAAHYRKAVALRPEYVEAYNNLGNALKGLGQWDEAIANYKKALRINPKHAEAYNNLGTAQRGLNQPKEAIASFQRALRLKPEYAEAYNNLGTVLQERRQLEEAMKNYQLALELKPEYAEAHNNLGSVLRDLDQSMEAATSYQTALALKPNYAEAHCNLGNVLRHLGNPETAIANYNKALRLRPDYAEAHNGLGAALREIGKLEEADASYRRAIALQPDFPEAHTNLGMLQLLQGNYLNGWTHYDWRKKIKEYQFRSRDYKEPLWDGTQLEGRTIFIHPEQGLGDFFQFVRYVPMVVSMGAKVVLEAPAQTVPLLKDTRIANTVVSNDSDLPPFDYHIPLMDLPRLLDSTLETLPSKTPYLCLSKKLQQKWEKQFGRRENFRVGIVWASNPKNRKLLQKSIDLALFQPLVQIPGIQIYSLQVDKKGEALARFGDKIIDLAPRLTDFSETAGAVSQLDLVVSVDTSVAHLVGALGRPVWTLIPFVGDWRWLLDREDSPWYPSMRLFRQPKRDDWTTVIDRVQTELVQSSRHF